MNETHPTFGQAMRWWLKLGWINFGGPAGQIALMHDELVERRRWIGHARFMHALNYCMLLPGPEAMQLATYVGWLLHGTLGGVLAGILFVLPGAALMLALSVVYAHFGEVAWVEGIFYGVRAAVVAIVIAAVIRLGQKGVQTAALRALAACAFVAIFFFAVPFPLIVLGAALLGAIGARRWPNQLTAAAHAPARGDAGAAIDDTTVAAAHTRSSTRRAVNVVLVHLALWAAPLVALGTTVGFGSELVAVGVFFSIAAMVTFGGAYAVLAYVAQAGVERAWLGPHDMTVGLGLAESTPGPLILSVQFVGYLAGASHAPAGWFAVDAGIVASLLTLWVTFVPCFLWILLGAPYIERLRGHRGLAGALTAVTSAVVGVVANLGVWLALRVLFREVREESYGPLVLEVPDLRTLDPVALALAVLGFAAIAWGKRSMTAVIGCSALVGMAYRLIALR